MGCQGLLGPDPGGSLLVRAAEIFGLLLILKKTVARALENAGAVLFKFKIECDFIK